MTGLAAAGPGGGAGAPGTGSGPDVGGDAAAGTLRFASAGVQVDVVGLGPPVAELVRDVGAGLLTAPAAPASHPWAPDHPQPSVARVLRLRTGTPAADGAEDGWVTVPAGASVGRAAAAVVAAVDRVVLGSSPCLLVHAAAVAGPGGAVVLPGRSGTGKTTLAAAAMQAGLVLLSDEAACLRPGDGWVVPHARPLGLSAASRALLGLAGDVPAAGAEDVRVDERAVAPGLLGAWARGPVPVAVVAVPVRGAGVAPAVEDWSRAQAVSELLVNVLGPSGPRSRWAAESAWRLLVEVVRGARVVRVRYDRPQDGARLLADLLA